MGAIFYKQNVYGSGGTGGSGGGNSITYGYDNPEDLASDGDLYILLDANDKEQGKFLYMTDEWVLISGRRYIEELVLYDNGTEGVTWTVSGGTKNADNIQVNTGGGTFTNYAVTDDAIDVTGYSILHVECHYRSNDYDLDFDVSSYTGYKYISFTYLTDSSHNECAVGLSDTKTGATTFRVDSVNGGDGIQKMFYMSLS